MKTARRQQSDPRLSLQSLQVLRAFIDAAEPLSGSDARKLVNLQSGTLYPILLRFEEAGWLKSYWESVNPSTAGRPRKRFYELTATGARKASEILSWLEGAQSA
ncbi:MAG: helix-turn-helix transcriptional regulator [Sulfuricaulis sp.]|nr:helix-turn-helix transcriptional regulator [Sulfuricaulis sp.]